LVAAARGIEAFIQHEGEMRLVASPLLRDDDLEAIFRGYEARQDIIQRAILRGIFDPERAPTSDEDLDRLALLAWLIAESRLDMKVAVPTSDRPGIYHEKVAIFLDEFGDRVAVAGSPNETQGGLLDNFEAVDLFCSWGGDAHRVERKVLNFERLWSDATPGLQVMEIPDAVRRELISATSDRVKRVKARFAGASTAPAAEGAAAQARTFARPEALTLREYQARAVENWWLNGRVGILAMATGTGKTVTALSAASEVVREEGGPLAIVILAPYVHLVDQWANELGRWGVSPIACYESSSTWSERVERSLKLQRAGARNVVVLVSTHDTASLPVFRALVRTVPSEALMVIADEVHRLGAEGLSSGLPANASIRLGLSATPERADDEAGNQRLLDYFDGVVFEFGIQDAISAGCLTPYEYLPDVVDLARDELEEYDAVVRRLERELAKPEGQRAVERLTSLQRQRSQVLNGARGKLERLRDDIEDDSPSRTLIYTSSRKQLSAVMDLCWDRGVVAHQFTGEEGRGERRRLLADLESRRIPALVAIRCLDEGVDVPAAERGYLLASSGNPREFVQRRGRLLRLSPGKELATIRDYVVIPRAQGPFEHQIMRREIERVMEFASSATNGSTALKPVMDALQSIGFVMEGLG
jgi:superfamily II DNA or RNA helicase